MSTNPLNENDWYCLAGTVWSEHSAVKALTYRLLKRIPASPWALDLLSQLDLDEATRSWAEENAAPGGLRVVDSNGTVLLEGDSVTLIKDLEVKGANFTAKRGTLVKSINLTEDPTYVEGRVNGIRIVLVSAYLKKA